MLYNRWWKEKGVAENCDADDTKGDANALGIDNVGGNSLYIYIYIYIYILNTSFLLLLLYMVQLIQNYKYI